MNHIELTRTAETKGLDGFKIQTATKVQLFTDSSKKESLFECVALEKMWRKNIKNVSCIPTGEYTWRLVGNSPIFGSAFIQIENVLDRENIRIQTENYYKESAGSIVVGRGYEYIQSADVLATIDSRETMNDLINRLTTHEGTLKISSIAPKDRVLNLSLSTRTCAARFPLEEEDY